ncbi:DUF441 domain-containing protein [Clostridium pasteurianum]|uniref:UPF0756 membrane protein Clopa_4685 n=1 Tax=Clostridium pasteurianum BC1 TaxID=86416 RepID=R4KFP4_CLOPA|nr:DUF441 domain-containing protein [Clostridium pasteurianum]AGK99374.1 putative membrane protein [Clostridium pasteurianum BC1]
MESNIILVIILAISIIGKANSVSVATAILLIIKLLNIEKYIFPALDKSGVFWALVLLIAAILIPIANGSISPFKIKDNLTSVIGIIALLLSFFTTYLSGLGLKYLTVQGHGDVMPALILGSIAAAAFLGGVPVGPLITTGLLALVMKVFHKE